MSLLGRNRQTERAKFFAKTFASFVLLYYVFGKVGWYELWNQVKGADLFYIPLYICLAFLVTLVSAVKWSLLSKIHGISASLSRFFGLYMVGYAFNNILPTSVGGDVLRAYELGKWEGKKQEALASVFMERFTGFTTLILFALMAVLLDQRFLGDIRLALPLAFAFATYLGIVIVLWNAPLLPFLRKRIPLGIVGKVLKGIESFQEPVYIYRKHKLKILYAMGYSVLFYVTNVLFIYVGLLVFRVHVSFASLFVAVPIMLIVFLIPISIGGIGVQEWAYYFVLGMVGVPGAVGLGLGLLHRAIWVFFGLLGVAIYPLVSSGGTIGSRGLNRDNARNDFRK